MKFSIIASSFFGLVAAVPAALYPRQYTNQDALILNFALTLEHLEDTFYRQYLSQYSAQDFVAAGYSVDTYNKLKIVSADETTHVAFLTAALTAAGATPVAQCTYNFGVNSVTSFLKTASLLEGVGVSAYTGAAANIMSKTYLTAAASILTVEARHSSYIRNTLAQVPFPSPFDVPLDGTETFSLASQFITSCPAGSNLPFKAFPVLTASPSNPAVIQTGTTITLLTQGYSLVGTQSNTQLYAAFITVTGPVFAPATPVAGGFTVKVPGTAAGAAPINGQTYIVITSCNQSVTDDTIAAGPAVIEVSN